MSISKPWLAVATAAGLALSVAAWINVQRPAPGNKQALPSAGLNASAEVERMYMEDLQAAQAQADALASAREEQANSAEALLNRMSEQQGIDELEAGINTGSGGSENNVIINPPLNDVPDGYVRAKNGELVDIEAIKRSVRAARDGSEVGERIPEQRKP